MSGLAPLAESSVRSILQGTNERGELRSRDQRSTNHSSPVEVVWAVGGDDGHGHVRDLVVKDGRRAEGDGARVAAAAHRAVTLHLVAEPPPPRGVRRVRGPEGAAARLARHEAHLPRHGDRGRPGGEARGLLVTLRHHAAATLERENI